MSSLIGEDGKIKLDRLTGPEKQILVEEFLKSDPLQLIWYAATSSMRGCKDQKKIDEAMQQVADDPHFTLWFKLYDSGILETNVTSRAEWLQSLRKELEK